MDPVVHFEIPADDVERARRFYGHCFGWNVVSVPGMGYTLLHTAPTDKDGMIQKMGAVNGGMLKRQRPIDRILITIQVKDLEASLGKAIQAGAKLLQGKNEVPGVGYTAYIQDTEGNPVGLIQSTRQ